MQLWRHKIRASIIHLTISVGVISCFLLVVSQFWYPGVLFTLEDVWQGLEILIPVDVILGPLLTLIIFVPGKKRLKFDLSVVAALQCGALLYGGIMIYQQRPVAYAFVVDRFEIVLASDIFADELLVERFSVDSGFPLLTYVLPISSDQERTDFILKGINFKEIPERHYPISQYIDQIATKSIDLRSISIDGDVLAQFKRQHDSLQNYLFLPLQASTGSSIIVVIDKRSSKVEQYLNADPWSRYIPAV